MIKENIQASIDAIYGQLNTLEAMRSMIDLMDKLIKDELVKIETEIGKLSPESGK